ncbi:rhamnulokinase family protein [Raineyella sp. LH-20]|uniref:rhamnulokinase n=1 Tax=Raineyella sp. LH-20 TaxID=3081204 RepID=UPI002953EB0D|nr:rhamnulokinase family protein [Raineyella sp. LH-20]WOP19324.1 rhamnulokinase family protein [Raineyella sp. LH-20]
MTTVPPTTAPPTTVAAVDLGATSGRVLTGHYRDGRLAIEEAARFPNGAVRVRTRAGGADLQWDVLALWQGIQQGLRVAGRRGPVDAVGIDTWGVDYGLLDRTGHLLGNPTSYRSSRTDGVPERFFERFPADRLYAVNGLQVQPFNTMFQLIADRTQASLGLADRLLLLPDLLGFWLTGREVAEVTHASTTGLLDVAARTWSAGILAALDDGWGIDATALLPDLVEPGTLLAPVDVPQLALATPAGAPTPLVAVGSHDTASAVVAVPAADDAFGYISCGTWSLVGVELDAPLRTEESRLANFTNELGVDGTVRYLRNVMGLWVMTECINYWRYLGQTDLGWDTLVPEAAGAEPLRSLIDMNDARLLAPGEMPLRIAEMCREAGEPVPRSRGEHLRCVTDSLALAYARALDDATRLSGKEIRTVHLVGGGSQNALLCQLTADATGRPVEAGPAEGTGLGNMLIQLRAIGAAPQDLTALRAVIRRSFPTVRYEPCAAHPWHTADGRVPRT